MNAELVNEAESVALAGMLHHYDLVVPPAAFTHPGRRALATVWKQDGNPCISVECVRDAEALSDRAAVKEAVDELDEFRPIAQALPRWKEACETVIQRHAIRSAAEKLERVQKQYDRKEVGAAALAQAWAQVASAEGRAAVALPAVGLFERMVARLTRTHGRRHSGISVPTMPLITTRLDGLRGLMFMGGEPGTGKTSLALQLAMDAARGDTDVVAMFVTCEMSPLEITEYATVRLAQLPYPVLKKGRHGNVRDPDSGLMLHKAEQGRMAQAYRVIQELGPRWSVVAPSDFGGSFDGHGGRNPFHAVVGMVERMKAESGATRAVVVFDNLQAMPVAEPSGGQWRGEQALERDRYTIAKLNELTDSEVIDAVIVISEQNKAGQGTDSAQSFLGTGRISYAADATVMLTDPEAYGKKENGEGVRETHYAKGIRHVVFTLKKGRAGMNRGTEELTYDFTLMSFREGFHQQQAPLRIEP
jgi:hypothetical protein